jgi:hypothetical protein
MDSLYLENVLAMHSILKNSFRNIAFVPSGNKKLILYGAVVELHCCLSYSRNPELKMLQA